MNWSQLSLFTENFAKLLDNGVMFNRAIEVASGSMTRRANRKFAGELREILLNNLDLPQQLASYKIPPFYLAMLRCGQITGRLPQALNAAAYYLRQFMPIKLCLLRCIQLSLAAYLLSLLLVWIFAKQLPIWPLVVLASVFLLPVYVKPIRYGRDILVAHFPFVGTWSRQLALLEFFLCLKIAYNSTLTVREMFDGAIGAIGNLHLRKEMSRTLPPIDRRSSFTDALAAVPFIPRGMIAAVNIDEISGTLENSFHGFATELRKLIDAKLELVKALATAVCIDFGILFPLLLILPLFVANPTIVALIIATMMGYVPLMCLRMALTQYLAKAAEVNLWWNNNG